MRTLDGCPENWIDILIIEDPMFHVRGEEWKVARKSLLTPGEFENRFNELLARGYSWININFGGVYQNNAIVFIEYPKESSGVPKEKVSINQSGPQGYEWDLDKKLCVVE
jgi:hypothetical protein